MNHGIAMKLLQLANGITDSSVKTAETLDILEKGQLTIRTDFSFEEKALDTVNRLLGYAIRALILVTLIISCCLLCTTSALTGDGITRLRSSSGSWFYRILRQPLLCAAPVQGNEEEQMALIFGGSHDGNRGRSIGGAAYTCANIGSETGVIDVK